MSTLAETAEMSEYRAVLASGIFPPGSNAARFLDFVCQEYFRGNVGVSEYAIAVQALGRRSDFDPKTDAIVRVEAHRVRKRLYEYYEHEGRTHSLRLIIPVGSHLPAFETARTDLSTPVKPNQSHVEIPSSQVERTTRLPRATPTILLVAIFLLAGIALVFEVMHHLKSVPLKTADTSHPFPLSILTKSSVRIACGRTDDYVDHLGRMWPADRDFSGGSAVGESYRKISRTESPTLFLTRREGGTFSYNIPLEHGYYELRLYFAETQYGPDNPGGGGESSRMMTVTANGKPLLTSFDPLSDAGGDNTADVRVFEGLSPAADGKLHLVFTETWPNKANVLVNAIEVMPNQSKVMQPIRWVASDSSVVDSQNRLWQPAQFYFGGLLRENNQEVTDTPDPEVYRSSRFGNFSYAIPVAQGMYTLKLYFDEYWFATPRGSSGGDGSRLFDVYCNGTTLLKNFDILKNAGGSYIAVTRTFRGLKPNAQGKLFLSFVPVRDYATVAALEVVSENGQ